MNVECVKSCWVFDRLRLQEDGGTEVGDDVQEELVRLCLASVGCSGPIEAKFIGERQYAGRDVQEVIEVCTFDRDRD